MGRRPALVWRGRPLNVERMRKAARRPAPDVLVLSMNYMDSDPVGARAAIEGWHGAWEADHAARADYYTVRDALHDTYTFRIDPRTIRQNGA